MNDLSQEDHDTSSEQDEDCALCVPCSLVQLARVVVVRVILVDVVGVIVDVLIAHIDVVQFT